MTRIKLTYVDSFTDRNGHMRYYFRRGKGPRISLPGLPGSNEFMVAYPDSIGGECRPSASYGTPTREPRHLRRSRSALLHERRLRPAVR